MPKSKKSRLTTSKKSKTAKRSPWAEHLHKCMDKYNITYKQAQSDGKCRNLYYLGHE
jgi:hypothetical protein